MKYLNSANGPEQTPLAWLVERLPQAEMLYALVGYLDRGGVQLIETHLRDLLERDGHVHIVVDGRDGRPRHSDLAWLLDIFAPYRDRASLTLMRDETVMHAKTFMTVERGTDDRHALVGSANFTRAGLSRNIEGCVEIDEGDDEEVMEAISAAFHACRDHPAATAIDLGLLASFAVPAQSPNGEAQTIGDLVVTTAASAAIAVERGFHAIPSGFVKLDSLLAGGAHSGQMVIVAARPSIGKSTLGLDWIRQCSIHNGVPSLLLSFEMSELEVVERTASAECRVGLEALRAGSLDAADHERINANMDRIANAPMHVNATCTPSMRSVVAECRRAVAENGVRLIVIDYVQLLHIDRRTESRQQEIAEISRALKQLARELDVALVVVSQLNRGPESRTDKRPVMSDLRESGSLEQDADVVILIHRADFYDKESRRAGEVDLILAKNRSGRTGETIVAAQLHFSRFIDLLG